MDPALDVLKSQRRRVFPGGDDFAVEEDGALQLPAERRQHCRDFGKLLRLIVAISRVDGDVRHGLAAARRPKIDERADAVVLGLVHQPVLTDGRVGQRRQHRPDVCGVLAPRRHGGILGHRASGIGPQASGSGLRPGVQFRAVLLQIADSPLANR